MDNIADFRKNALQVVDWICSYYENIESYPVKSAVCPGEILTSLPPRPPQAGEPFETLMGDLDNLIMPGITHWQSPGFFAYFPANTSFPSILAEMLTAALGTQCMKWETSPAAAELEELVMNWLRETTGLPEGLRGVIQDSATSATLAALISAREKKSHYSINAKGFTGERYRVYCSSEAHSSIEKAVKIIGIGQENLVKIAVDEKFALVPDDLEKAIRQDIENGLTPLCVVAALGTTGSTAIDPLKAIGPIARRYGLWLHADAAYAGSCLILPEMRHIAEGAEEVDSLVFNPHKWLFTNFDCTAYFVRDKEALINTFNILPEYLKTKTDGLVNNYCDWGVPLGRRFRTLKLWFVMRSYGLEKLQERLREQIGLARWFEGQLKGSGKFELMAPLSINLVCFRYNNGKVGDNKKLNDLNEELLQRVNQTGKMYITHTRLKNLFTLRLQTGQTNTAMRHVKMAYDLLEQTGDELAKRYDG